jgi:hypothetical protein
MAAAIVCRPDLKSPLETACQRPRERCLERLAAFREAGVDLPILYSPIGMEAAQAVVKAFRQ